MIKENYLLNFNFTHIIIYNFQPLYIYKENLHLPFCLKPELAFNQLPFPMSVRIRMLCCLNYFDIPKSAAIPYSTELREVSLLVIDD